MEIDNWPQNILKKSNKWWPKTTKKTLKTNIKMIYDMNDQCKYSKQEKKQIKKNKNINSYEPLNWWYKAWNSIYIKY